MRTGLVVGSFVIVALSLVMAFGLLLTNMELQRKFDVRPSLKTSTETVKTVPVHTIKAGDWVTIKDPFYSNCIGQIDNRTKWDKKSGSVSEVRVKIYRLDQYVASEEFMMDKLEPYDQFKITDTSEIGGTTE